MKVLILFALAATAAVSQTADCANQIACEDAVRTRPKNSLANFRLGEIYFALGNYQSAAIHFQRSTDGDQIPKWIVVWSHLNLGKIFDTVGTRNRALTEYRRVQQTEDNTRGALDEAARYLAEPFRRN
jgi:tetratricopeptide (TPR) repeat protein